MNIPKYKAWNKDKSIMVDVRSFCIFDKGAISYKHNGELGFATLDPDNRDFEDHDGYAILMQAIGLVDNKGVDIYEGDIVTTPLMGCSQSFTYQLWHNMLWNITEQGRYVGFIVSHLGLTSPPSMLVLLVIFTRM